MKKTRLVGCLLVTLLAGKSINTMAAIDYWDPEGAVSAPTTAQLTGTWTATSANWSTSSSGGGTLIAVPSTTAACFCSGSTAPSGGFIVTVSGTVSCSGLFNGPFNPPGFNVTLSGGTITLTGTTPGVCAAGSDSDPLVVNSVLAGGSSTQVIIEGTDQITLNGVNTYSGGTSIGLSSAYPNYFNSIVNFNNGSAFGTGTITLTQYGSGCAIAAEGSSAITVPNNFTLAASCTNNFVGNTAGITYSGNWSMGAHQLTFETSGTAGNLDIISGVLSGSVGFVVSDAGTLELTGTNTYTGNTGIISPAVLTIGGSGSLGSGTYAGNITNAGKFTYNSSASQTLSGVISGAGALSNAGPGTLILSGLNTYTGNTTISGGTLQVHSLDTPGTSGPLGNFATSAANTIILSGGTLQYSSANAHDYSGRFSTAANQHYNIDVNGQNVTYATALTSSGGELTLNSTAAGGTLTLSANNTYSGATTLSSGTAAIGTFNTPFGNGTGTINLAGGNINATLNRGTTGTLESLLSPASISGNSQLQATTTTGIRYLQFGGPVSSTGGTLIITNSEATNGGAIFCVVFTNTVTLNIPVVLTNAVAGNTEQLGVWNYSAIGDQTYNGIISGNGSIYRSTELAAGTGARVILTAANTYSGGTSNNDGEIACGISSTGPADTGVTSGPIGTGTMTVGNANAKISAYGGAQVVGNHVVLSSSPLTFTGSNSLTMSGNFDFQSAVRVLAVSNTNLTELSGAILNGGLIVSGGNTLTLAGANVYTGATTVSNNSTLALGSSGSISNSSSLSILAGSTFDVSAFGDYVFGGTTLTASGTTSNSATINGGPTVDFGSQAVSLSFTPTSFSGDTGHPALVVANGALNLNGNSFTVSNAAATALGIGIYTVASVTGGTINGTPNATVTVTGAGLANGASASLAVSGGSVNLVVTGATPTFSGLTASPSTTYGSTSVTLGGTISGPGPVYPASGETINVTINGVQQSTTITGTSGQFSLNYNPSSPTRIPASVTPYPITYSYGGDAGFNAASNASTALTVNAATLTVTATGVNKNYDGTTTATVNLSDNRFAGDSFTDSYGSASFANAGPGPGIAVSVAGISISGGMAGDYTLASTTAGTSANILAPGATWTGADYANSSNWSDGTNWLSGTAPDLVGDSVDFGGVTGPMPVMNGSYLVYSLTFDSTAGSFDLTNTPGSVLSIGVGVTNNSTNGQYLLMPVALVGTNVSSWSILSNGAPITISGVLTDSGGGLAVSGRGLLELTGSNTFTGPISNAAGVTVDVGGSGVLGGGDYETNVDDNGTVSYSSSAAQTLSGTISGAGSLVENGAGPLTLSGTNIYTGRTAINGGTLALAATGSIADSASLSIAGGGTFDVSSQAAYSFGSTTLSASGDQPAAINGASNGTVTVFSALTLNFDGTDPALTLAQGTLVLSNNAFTINAATPLAAGAYNVVNQASNNITDLSGTYPTPTGTAIGAGETASIAVSGADVVLTVQSNTTLTVGSSTGGASSYGQPVSFSAMVTGSDGGGSVAFYLDGSATPIAGCSAIALIAGMATTPNITNLNVGLHSIAATYSGDALSTSSSNTLAGGQTVIMADQTITFPPLANQTYGVAPYTISATATSGLPVSFAVVTGPASVTGSLVSILGAGSVSIQASQAGNSNYNAALPVTNSFTVNPLAVDLSGSRPYDGTATALFSILTITNIVGSDNVNLASGSATLASASVGASAITSAGTLALGGTSATNYTLTGASGTVTILNPYNPFSITSSSLDVTGTNFVVCWQSVPGVVYCVLTNTSLTPPQNWAMTGGPITATNTTTCFTLPGGIMGNTNAFVVIKQ